MMAAMGEPPPRAVLLFSGHMVDAPGRPRPRFPAGLVPAARRAIRDAVAREGTCDRDRAVCGGACGGDLLFAEAALDRGARLELRIPFDEDLFLARSVDFAGPWWRDLYDGVRNHPRTEFTHLVEEAGPGPGEADPFARANQWLLLAATRWGDSRLRYISLWDGRKGDGGGGSAHMHDLVRVITHRIAVIDPGTLREDGEETGT